MESRPFASILGQIEDNVLRPTKFCGEPTLRKRLRTFRGNVFDQRSSVKTQLSASVLGQLDEKLLWPMEICGDPT